MLKTIEKVNSVDRLFLLFKSNLKEIFERETGEDSVIIDGSVFDIFLRQCILCFNQMMFEDVSKLYSNFLLWKESEPYDYEHSMLDVSSYFSKMQDIESEVTQKSHSQINAEINSINCPADRKNVLLHSLNDSFAGHSIPAVDNHMKYIDHSLLELKENADRTSLTFNVHNAIIPMSGVYQRIGNVEGDQSLIMLIECIKQAQNKGDNHGIIQSLVWL